MLAIRWDGARSGDFTACHGIREQARSYKLQVSKWMQFSRPELLHRLARSEPATAEKARERWAVKVQFMGAEPVKPKAALEIDYLHKVLNTQM